MIWKLLFPKSSLRDTETDAALWRFELILDSCVFHNHNVPTGRPGRHSLYTIARLACQPQKAYMRCAFLSATPRLNLTSAFLLSPPSTLCPLLCSHKPSRTFKVATLPFVPLTGCT